MSKIKDLKNNITYYQIDIAGSLLLLATLAFIISISFGFLWGLAPIAFYVIPSILLRESPARRLLFYKKRLKILEKGEKYNE